MIWDWDAAPNGVGASFQGAPRPPAYRGAALVTPPGATALYTPVAAAPVVPPLLLVLQRVPARADEADRCAACWRQAEIHKTRDCVDRTLTAAARCMGRTARERVRDGVQNAVVVAGVAGAIGWLAGGPAGGFAAAVGAMPLGFAEGIIQSIIFGHDYHCGALGRAVWTGCRSELVDYSQCGWIDPICR